MAEGSAGLRKLLGLRLRPVVTTARTCCYRTHTTAADCLGNVSLAKELLMNSNPTITQEAIIAQLNYAHADLLHTLMDDAGEAGGLLFAAICANQIVWMSSGFLPDNHPVRHLSIALEMAFLKVKLASRLLLGALARITTAEGVMSEVPAGEAAVQHGHQLFTHNILAMGQLSLAEVQDLATVAVFYCSVALELYASGQLYRG